MKIQENYFYRLDNSKDVKVIWKRFDKACVIEIGVEYPTAIVDLDRLSGIPITEDLLKRMPFVFDNMEDTNEDNTWYWLKYGNYFKFNSDKSCGFEAIFITINGFTFKIQYLHDFQNLYYTLTGLDVVIYTVS